jgi:hypothetical protein
MAGIGGIVVRVTGTGNLAKQLMGVVGIVGILVGVTGSRSPDYA